MMSCGKVDVVHVRVDFFPRKKEMDQSRIYLKKKSVSDSGYLRVLRGGGFDGLQFAPFEGVYS